MGAFGRLLIQRWGGNLDYYDGNYKDVNTKPIKKTKKEIDQDLLEKELYKLECLTQTCENLILKGEEMLKQINNDVKLQQIFTTKKAFNNFISWRKDFLNKNKTI